MLYPTCIGDMCVAVRSGGSGRGADVVRRDGRSDGSSDDLDDGDFQVRHDDGDVIQLR